ncbi:MAG: hypothetical protein GF417_02285, partial [Candidatus Latescibacteria bacterium]|nr:hypothetical protein [bacterium]MBD3423258.1 hypothetical protein [Candidatus Latescibacterota bacterium]
MGENERKYLIKGKFSLEEIVDIERLRGMLNDFSLSAGYQCELYSCPEWKCLISTGKADVCDRFHLENPAVESRCGKSRSNLRKKSARGERAPLVRRCDNGFMRGIAPVSVYGVHLADLMTGPVLFDEPDMNLFRKQAEENGYDTGQYLELLGRIPVISREEFMKALSFLAEMTVVLTERGLAESRNR